MTQIKSIADNLIQSAKSELNSDNIRFVKAYNNHTAEKPVSGILAVFEIRSVEQNVGESDENSKLNARLFAGQNVTGDELCAAALGLAESLKTVDENGCIKKLTVSEAAYDKNVGALYRDVKLTVSDYGESDNVEAVKVYIGSQLLSGITSVKTEQKQSGVELYEFHSGEPYAVINKRTVYEITLGITSSDFSAPENGFTLTIESGSNSESYTGCNISKKTVTTDNKGQIVNTLMITSNRKVTA